MPWIVQNRLAGEDLPRGKVVRFKSETRQFEGTVISVDGPWAVINVVHEWDPDWRTVKKLPPEEYDVPVTVLFPQN